VHNIQPLHADTVALLLAQVTALDYDLLQKHAPVHEQPSLLQVHVLCYVSIEGQVPVRGDQHNLLAGSNLRHLNSQGTHRTHQEIIECVQTGSMQAASSADAPPSAATIHCSVLGTEGGRAHCSDPTTKWQ
jgi:hypothetical protein